MKNLKRFFILIFLCTFAFACIQDQNKSDDKSKSDSSQSSSSSSSNSGTLSTSCGLSIDGTLQKNPKIAPFIKGRLSDVVSAELYIFSSVEDGTKYLLKLPAVADNGTSNEQRYYIKNLINSAGTVDIYRTREDCVVEVPGGGKAFIANIVLGNGKVLAEELLKTGHVKVDEIVCENQGLISCYNSIYKSDYGTNIGNQVVSNFLWKPVSDKDGKLTVLLNPGSVDVYVGSEKLYHSGSGNGRATIVRGNKPGCNYPAPIRVKVLEHNGKLVAFPGGKSYYEIPNGCKRTEFK